jgi:serine/threonine protein kinase
LRSVVLTAVCRTQAPEVCNEQPYDTSADVWSVGVIFLHLLTLRIPNSQALFRGNIPNLAHLERTYGADSCSCMCSMLQVEPASRPSPEKIEKSVEEAAARRGDFHAGDGGIRATHPGTPDRDPPPRKDIALGAVDVAEFEKPEGYGSRRVDFRQSTKICACLIQ